MKKMGPGEMGKNREYMVVRYQDIWKSRENANVDVGYYGNRENKNLSML